MATGGPQAEPLPTLLDVEEVALHLNITVRHLRRLVFERKIPYMKVGNLLRFDPGEVASWLKEREVRSRHARPGVPRSRL